MTTVHDVLPPDAPEVHVALLSQWLQIKKSADPSRSDFDSGNLYPRAHEAYEIVRQLGEANQEIFCFGRVSPDAETRIGRPLEGHDVKEAFDKRLYAAVETNYRAAIETGEPHYWERCSSFYGREPQHYKRLLLPLVDDHGQAGWLLSSMVWPFHEGF